MKMGRFDVVGGKKGVLGEGSFSVVQKATDTKTGKEVAFKSYKLGDIRNSKSKMDVVLKKFRRQIEVLEMLQAKIDVDNQKNARLVHPMFPSIDCDKLFVGLVHCSRDKDGVPGPDVSDGEMYVVQELADYSMKDYLAAKREEGRGLRQDAIRFMCKNFVLSVAAMHAKGLVHLDLKPENIMRAGSTWKLIDVDGCVKIGSTISINDSSIAFSPCYCAPEWATFLIEEDQNTIPAHDALDVWSVGISLCELIALDAVLKPKYASIYRQSGSHRKAQFMFLQWLAAKDEKLMLDRRIGEQGEK
jgi:serine/threonine protein kinase